MTTGMTTTMNKKVYVVGGANWYAQFIDDVTICRSMEEADIVLFTGGEDVNPAMYGATTHPRTYTNPFRDMFEESEFEYAKALENVKLFVGICRGSQLLCVLYGGKLIQDVTHHAIGGSHSIVGKDGDIYDITSTHHQMQYPFNLEEDKYDILYWAEPKRSTIYEGNLIDPSKVVCEPEIVLYKGHINGLAIQGHPEAMSKKAPVIKMLNELINKELNVKIV